MTDTAKTVRNVGGQVVYVLLGNLFTLVIGMPLQIYVSRVLGAGGLGTYSLIEAAMSTVAGLLGFGIAPTLVRFIPVHLERRESYGIVGLIGYGALILFVAGGSVYLILLLNLGRIEQFVDDGMHYGDAIVLMGLMIPLSLFLYFFQQALRGFQEIRYVTMGSSVMQLAVKAAICVGAFAIGMRLEGYVIATVISALCAVLWMGIGLLRILRKVSVGEEGPSPERREWMKYAMISYAWSFIGVLTGNLDRFFLGYFNGSDAVGVFVVVRQLQQMPIMFDTMLLTVTVPMFAAAQARNDSAERQHLYSLTIDWVMRASLPLLIFLAAFGQPLLGLFGAQFANNGLAALYIFIAAQTFNLACGPIGYVAWMSGLEGMGLRVSIATTVLTAALLIALVPRFGIIGVALASALGILFINTFELFVTRRRLGIHWQERRFLGWVLPSAAALMVDVAIRWIAPFLAIGTFAMAAELVLILLSTYAVFATANLLQGLNQDDQVLLRHLTAILRQARAAES